MKKSFAFFMVVLFATLLFTSQKAVAQYSIPTKMDWWYESRFGMFIHFGSYSYLAQGEWAMSTGWSKTKYQTKVSANFNPINFNAGTIARLAQKAGMKYLVITAKHHEGFSMWDTKVASFKDTTGTKEYDLPGFTAFKTRDVLKELKDSCDAVGVKFCLYYSILDWNHASQTGYNFTKMKSMEARTAYIADMKAQLKELIDNYHPAILWFDGDWTYNFGTPTLASWWTKADGIDLYNYLTGLDPNLLVNERVFRGADLGDWNCPEQTVPATPENRPWETCQTMNGSWGYASWDNNYKSTQTLIQELVRVVSRDGNYLLNIGPKGDGSVTPQSINTLDSVGNWMKTYSESIYGTTRSPFSSEPVWGLYTKKDGKLYTHVFTWPSNGLLKVPSITNTIQKIYLLNDSSKSLNYKDSAGYIRISVPVKAPNPNNSVVVISVTGVPMASKMSMERKQLFDGDWKFFLGDEANAKANDFNDASWRSLDLPHDWSIEGTVHPKNPTGGGGGYFPAGIGWYRKTFHAPVASKAKKIILYFEGVYMNSEVFINGKSLGVYPYGYSSFSYDLTPYLDFGKENVIAVRVDNSQHVNSRWYSGSGIYRHVWLLVAEPIHVAHWGVAVSTPEVSAKKATVLVKTKIKNETTSAQRVVVKTILWNKDSKSVGNAQVHIQLPANSEKEITQTVQLANPLLWTPETPHLYQAQIQVLKEKKVLDDTKTTFGVRSIKFSAERGFELNGKTVKLNGGCVHHDNGCLGAAAFDRAEERKVELLKAGGFNAVRTSHNPPSESFLDACDRLGLLVMDESFDCWKIGKNRNDYSKHFNQWWERDLEAMVLRDRNHPSVFMWSIGNEIPERGDHSAIETANMLAKAIKKMDSDRPITSAIVDNGKDWSKFDTLMAVHDVSGYNYHLWSAPADHQRVPTRIIVHTESYPKDAFSNWKLVQENSFVIGDFVWTAMDYLGESGIGRTYYSGEVPGEHWEHEFFPWHGAYCGDIDLIGWRKPISHYRSMLYNNAVKLYMAVREPAPSPIEIKETWWSVWPTWESWTWPGFENKDIQVEVYSKYPKVRLYLNNKLIGEQATTRDQQFKASFTLAYSAGLLKAVGVENDQEMESTTLKTAGEATKMKLTADRSEIRANGQDLSYITIELTDEEGIFQPNAANRLHFKIDGPGVIAGVDNANLKDCDLYVGNTRKAWKGRALVVVRSTRQSGNIKLTVSSDHGMKSTLLINAKDK